MSGEGAGQARIFLREALPGGAQAAGAGDVSPHVLFAAACRSVHSETPRREPVGATELLAPQACRSDSVVPYPRLTREALGDAAVEATAAAAEFLVRDEAAAAHRAWRVRLAELNEQVQRICRGGQHGVPRCATGLPTLDLVLEGGFQRGAIHEWIVQPGAAGRSLALWTAARAAGTGGQIVYIDSRGDFYPPAAASLGVPLERLILARPAGLRDALWVCEQVLRCRTVAAVILPLRRLETRVSRRLQLAAEDGQNLGLLLRDSPADAPTFAATRLRLEPVAGRLPLLRVRVTVMKLRSAGAREPVLVDLPPGPVAGRAEAIPAPRVRWTAAG